MDDVPLCPEWWPLMLWKIHFPPKRPGPGPGPINYPPAIDHIMAGLTIHSLTYMLLDKTVAQDVRHLAEKTVADTAHNLTKLHTMATEAEPTQCKG